MKVCQRGLLLLTVFFGVSRLGVVPGHAFSCQPGSWLQEVKNVLLEPVIERLKSKGFVCLDPTKNPGSARRCVGTLPGYPKKVAVYIPIHYDTQESNPTVVTHLHGDAVDPSFEKTLSRYRLGDELHRSGAKKLLVVPESVHQCETYRKHLSTGVQFDAFQNRLKDLFQEVGLFRKDPAFGTITRELTGHSRAYLPIGNILKSPSASVKQVTLFDSIYCGYNNRLDTNEVVPAGTYNENASCQGLRKFAQEHSPRLRSYYREGSPTEIGTHMILPKTEPKKEAVGGVCTGRFPLKPVVDHLSVMKGHFGRALAEDFSSSCSI